jgi:FkbM family methyltransferase
MHPAWARASRAAFRVGLQPRPDRSLSHIGTPYGGWAVPIMSIDSSWVCYTAGVGEDASFDISLAAMGCHVIAIDPTPRAIEYMKPLLAEHPGLRLAPYAVWIEDAELEFFPPADPDHVSFSATNRQHTHEPIIVPARTIASIAEEFGHERIDLLKLDIEGAEYPVLDSLDLKLLGVRVLCVEYHADHGWLRMFKAANSVKRQGYRVSGVNGTDVTFLKQETL